MEGDAAPGKDGAADASSQGEENGIQGGPGQKGDVT